MTQKQLTLWSCFVLLLWGCATKSPQQSAIAQDSLFGTWNHAIEEDTDSTKTFYPVAHELPPARFREQVTFEENGNVSLLQLAANDAHGTIVGSWEWQDGDILSLTFKATTNQSWMVITLIEDKLVIKK